MELHFRQAKAIDIKSLVKMLADDELGASREDDSETLNNSYIDAFESIVIDPNNELTVVESNGDLVGMLQLTFIPYLTHMGTWRCMIEGVRIARAHRGKGLGSRFIKWAIKRAGERECGIVQLTSDKQRKDEIRFYKSLGFGATHEGFKLKI